MKNSHLVFVPSSGAGHLTSEVGLMKLLVDRDPRLSITVFVMQFPFHSDKERSLANESTDRIRFTDLPQDSIANYSSAPFSSDFMVEFIDRRRSALRKVISDLMTESTQPIGVVLDHLFMSMIDVVDEFGIPSYAFVPSNAAFLGCTLHLQALQDEERRVLTEVKVGSADLSIPGFVNSVPVKVLPSHVLETGLYLNIARDCRKAKGILVNTFVELEPLAIKSLQIDTKVPPIYPVGPILHLGNSGSVGLSPDNQLEVINWLDNRPPSSVLFICFGSGGSLHSNQIAEIAYALERSGRRFLWSLRQPKFGDVSDNKDTTRILPEGFLERTQQIGKVIGWAPQAAVLAHPSVGGFITHCGWNSILESLWYGVPIAAWPLYAEQQLNAFTMIKELGLAVEIKMDYKMGSGKIVDREEIEKAIAKLMDCDKDRKVGQKVKEMSRLALEEGGTSYNSLGSFIEKVTCNM